MDPSRNHPAPLVPKAFETGRSCIATLLARDHTFGFIAEGG